jgi:hypothetical protein
MQKVSSQLKHTRRTVPGSKDGCVMETVPQQCCTFIAMANSVDASCLQLYIYPPKNSPSPPYLRVAVLQQVLPTHLQPHLPATLLAVTVLVIGVLRGIREQQTAQPQRPATVGQVWQAQSGRCGA